ncbi:hypothetical protein Ddye_014195 [Dipteronia dyeriana]|uniref:RING-type E3 ubiquitin transferase n=1 Tax=Dipteronia dyeriana TaxID=168575 RepID=A0AAE0CKC9_9ROSI|nr:hypothetical protein Ddye_014195 [Dipteronia dyeriana]
MHSMLSSTGLPPEYIEGIVSDRVFLCGWRMERDPMNLDYKVLTMTINITVTTPYDNRQEIDRTISESSSSAMTWFTPVSKDAIQRLEKVRFDQDDECKCMICLEEFSTGVETMRMPCGHLYHEECIVKWLETSHMCPLCRYEMPCVCDDTT